MQSYTTQAHQRNYQGNVVLHTLPARKQHRKNNPVIIGLMVVAITVVGGMLGVMTLHNQQLKHRIKALESQSHTDITSQAVIQTNTTKRGKTLPYIPISDQKHATETMPAVDQH